jgi:outer membrane protein assembly factor BamB
VIVVAARAVVAIDPGTGETLWEAERNQGRAGPPAVAGDLVLHSSGSSPAAAVVARRVEDGREVWRYFSGAPALGGITVEEDRAYIGDRAGEVVALDVRTGEEEWSFRTEGRVETTPAVADGVVVVIAENHETGAATAYGLDAEDGEERWPFSPPTVAIGASSPAIDGGTAFFSLGTPAVHARDLTEGTERWSETIPVRSSAGNVPVVADGSLFAIDLADLYRLDPATGEERWVFRLPGLLVQTSPVVTETAAVFGDGEGLAAAIDLSSGLLVWKARIGEGPVGPAAADEEHVYLATLGRQGTLVSLEHDPEGTLLSEASPTTLFPGRALLNFAAALALVGLVTVGIFRFVLPRLARGRRQGADS